MNWFIKISALEREWWNNFYYHLSKVLEFTFPETTNYAPDPSDMTPRLDPRSFSSGIDGNCIFFMFSVWFRGYPHKCGIKLCFNESLIKSKMTWQFSNMRTLHTDKKLIESSWYVLKDYGHGDWSPVDVDKLPPEYTTPQILAKTIREAIIHGDDEDNDEPEISPPPIVPSKKPTPVLV